MTRKIFLMLFILLLLISGCNNGTSQQYETCVELCKVHMLPYQSLTFPELYDELYTTNCELLCQEKQSEGKEALTEQINIFKEAIKDSKKDAELNF
ncbi:MAG: hypothetical protein KJ597_07370 [Nanoarchaeota archaeon]|nr:hypothetical protein [Nanoarchaeota archaeon]MBU1623364.1 hypothetical protein [Nanoarchaeota archaeon]